MPASSVTDYRSVWQQSCNTVTQNSSFLPRHWPWPSTGHTELSTERWPSWGNRDGWLNANIVYPWAVTHPSTNRARRTVTSYDQNCTWSNLYRKMILSTGIAIWGSGERCPYRKPASRRRLPAHVMLNCLNNANNVIDLNYQLDIWLTSHNRWITADPHKQWVPHQ